MKWKEISTWRYHLDVREREKERKIERGREGGRERERKRERGKERKREIDWEWERENRMLVSYINLLAFYYYQY